MSGLVQQIIDAVNGKDEQEANHRDVILDRFKANKVVEGQGKQKPDPQDAFEARELNREEQMRQAIQYYKGDPVEAEKRARHIASQTAGVRGAVRQDVISRATWVFGAISLFAILTL